MRVPTSWRRLLAACALLLALVLASAARVAHADVALPVVIDRGAIQVRAAAGLERQARRLADRAEADLARIAADLEDLPRPATVEIRLVEETAQLALVSPPGRGAPRWAAGVAYPDLGVLALALRRGGQHHDVDKTLSHELAHLALGAAVPHAPRWLHEGFAWQHAREFSFARMETLAGMAWFGGVTPLDELERGFPAAEAPASRAYAQSYDFVGFLVTRGAWPDDADDGDRWPFRRFLRALSDGMSVEDAAHEAYGVGMDVLFEEWRQSLLRRYMLIPASVFASFLWVVAAVLLILGWRRRRRRARAQMALWQAEDDAADRRHGRAATWVVAPEPTALDREVLETHGGGGPRRDDGTDPPDPTDDLDDDRRPPPRWMN